MTPDEQFKEKQASMSDAELIELCHEQISALAKSGGNSFRMCIPPSVKDTDMLFSELIERYKSIVGYEWIPVTIKPEKGDEYNVVWQLSDGGPPVSTSMDYDSITDTWTDPRGVPDQPVTTVLFWRPIPSPPFGEIKKWDGPSPQFNEMMADLNYMFSNMTKHKNHLQDFTYPVLQANELKKCKVCMNDNNKEASHCVVCGEVFPGQESK